MILRLAWRNLWRQPRRTLLNLCTIAFSAMVMVALMSLQTGVYATMKGNVLRIMDGFAQIQPPGWLDEPELRKTLAQSATIVQRTQALGLAAAPRAAGFAILSGNGASLGAELVGVDPQAERRVSLIPGDIHAGSYLVSAGADDDGIVLGATLAKNLHVAPGDHLALLGNAADGSVAADALTVRGTFATGVAEIDRQFAEMSLQRFRDDFSLDAGPNVIAIAGPRLADVEHRFAALGGIAAANGAVARSWSELEPGLAGAIRLDMTTSSFWYVTLLAIVVIIILNTLLMAVLERTHEFGVMLALGLRHTLLGRIIWLELFLLVGLGATAGAAAGAVLVAWLTVHGFTLPGADTWFAQWGLPGRLYPQLTLLSLTLGPGVIVVSVALSGIFPYLRIRRLEPVAAMRAV